MHEVDSYLRGFFFHNIRKHPGKINVGCRPNSAEAAPADRLVLRLLNRNTTDAFAEQKIQVWYATVKL